MPPITLLTDFGLEDEYVGVVKGVILSVNPSAVIVDISHRIDPQDLVQAAWLIRSAYRYFPKETVHTVVVDPGVGSERAILAVEMGGYRFLAPDNGVLTLVMEETRVEAVVRVTNPAFFLHPVSKTFHGRDIFAPVAARLSMGIDLNELGESINPEETIRLPMGKPRLTGAESLSGEVISIDRFGNLITNIDIPVLEKLLRTNPEKRPIIRAGTEAISGLSESYRSAGPNQPLAIIGSRGTLEIAINGGSARETLKVGRGQEVTVLMEFMKIES